MKRIASLLMSLCLCLSCFTAVAEESAYVTQWDLTQIYADDAAFEADCAALEAIIPQLEALRGKLSTAEGLLEYKRLKSETTLTLERIKTYPSLLQSLDATSVKAKELEARANALKLKFNQAISYYDDEIGAMTLDERRALVASPKLEPYAYSLRNMADESTAYLSEDAANVLAVFNDVLFSADNVFNALVYGDLPYPTYTMPDGEVVELNTSTYVDAVYNGTPRDVLIDMAKLRSQRFKPFENSFAACLDSHMRTLWDHAKLKNFGSSLEYMLQKEDVDPAVYDMLIEAGHEGAADNQRYYSIIKRALGLEGKEMYGFDTFLPATDFQPQKTFDQCVDDILAALSIFGDEYTDIIKRMFATGHIDAFPADNKRTGGFSASLDGKLLPFICMNYYNADDAPTLAHELGHSLYSYLSAENQPAQYVEPTNYTHEVASTTNEIIFYRTMYDKAQSDDERLYYLQKQLDLFTGSFYSQLMYAEFEDYCYKTIEGGGALAAQSLNAEYMRLQELYEGDTFAHPDGSEAGWCSIPHFYYNYYVYTYAAAECYAAVIANRIYDGVDGAKDSYMSFLKLGSSVSPADALAVAGVDTLDKKTYDDALEYYRTMLAQYEALVTR